MPLFSHPPATDQDQDLAATPTSPGLPDLDPMPGWGPPPMPLPGRTSPDPPSPAGGEDGAAPAVSEPPSRLTPESFKSQAGAYSAIAKALLVAIGGYLNMLVAVDDEDPAFLPDDDDQAVIPPPVGRLAARRIPLGKLAENYTDLQDIGEAAVGLAAWLAKGVTAVLNARRARRRAQAEAEAARQRAADN